MITKLGLSKSVYLTVDYEPPYCLAPKVNKQLKSADFEP